VRNGLALDWPQYSKGDYADAKAEAEREQRGMWGGSFKEPWNYRACRPVRWKAGRLFGRLKLADKHLASVIHCIDDEIIGWLERRERRKRDRLAGSRQSVYRYLL
jgi:hypothetical protein